MRAGDTLIVDFEDTKVVSVSKKAIKVMSPSGMRAISPSVPIYRDEGNIMRRSSRLRTKGDLFAFTDEPAKKKRAEDPLGLGLVGISFTSTDSPTKGAPNPRPKQYTIVGAGDPRGFIKRGSMKPVPIAEYKETGHLNGPNARTHQSFRQSLKCGDGLGILGNIS